MWPPRWILGPYIRTRSIGFRVFLELGDEVVEVLLSTLPVL